MDNQIFKLPICPQCKDTKYVFRDLAILETYKHCDRCSISWDLMGNIKDYSKFICKDGEQYITPTKRRIKKEAERLWAEAGNPDGRSEEFWLTAEKNVL